MCASYYTSVDIHFSENLGKTKEANKHFAS